MSSIDSQFAPLRRYIVDVVGLDNFEADWRALEEQLDGQERNRALLRSFTNRELAMMLEGIWEDIAPEHDMIISEVIARLKNEFSSTNTKPQSQ